MCIVASAFADDNEATVHDILAVGVLVCAHSSIVRRRCIAADKDYTGRCRNRGINAHIVCIEVCTVGTNGVGGISGFVEHIVVNDIHSNL